MDDAKREDDDEDEDVCDTRFHVTMFMDQQVDGRPLGETQPPEIQLLTAQPASGMSQLPVQYSSVSAASGYHPASVKVHVFVCVTRHHVTMKVAL